MFAREQGLHKIAKKYHVHVQTVSPFLRKKRHAMSFWAAVRLATYCGIDLSKLQDSIVQSA